MEITERQLEEFRKIYQEEFGKTISKEDAIYQATKLLRLMEIICAPLTAEELRGVERERREFLEGIDRDHK